MENVVPKRTGRLTAILVSIALVLPVVLYAMVSLTKIPVPTKEEIPTEFPTDEIGTTRVIKTQSQSVINYWLFGRVVAVENTDSTGIRFVFTIDGDPFATRLRMVLLGDSGIGEEKNLLYRVLWYDADFSGTQRLEFLDEKSVRSRVLESGSLVQLRFPHVKGGTNLASPDVMRALESVNSGNWQNLPKDRFLYAESVGIVGP